MSNSPAPPAGAPVDSDDAISESLADGLVWEERGDRFDVYGNDVPAWAKPSRLSLLNDASGLAMTVFFVAKGAVADLDANLDTPVFEQLAHVPRPVLSPEDSWERRERLAMTVWRMASTLGYQLGVTAHGPYLVHLRLQVGAPLIAGHLAAHAIGLISPEVVRGDVQALTRAVWPRPGAVNPPLSGDIMATASALYHQMRRWSISHTDVPGLEELARLGRAGEDAWAASLRALLHRVLYTAHRRSVLNAALGHAILAVTEHDSQARRS